MNSWKWYIVFGLNKARSSLYVISLSGNMFFKLAILLPCSSSIHWSATVTSAINEEFGLSFFASWESLSFRADLELKKSKRSALGAGTWDQHDERRFPVIGLLRMAAPS